MAGCGWCASVLQCWAMVLARPAGGGFWWWTGRPLGLGWAGIELCTACTLHTQNLPTYTNIHTHAHRTRRMHRAFCSSELPRIVCITLKVVHWQYSRPAVGYPHATPMAGRVPSHPVKLNTQGEHAPCHARSLCVIRCT